MNARKRKTSSTAVTADSGDSSAHAPTKKAKKKTGKRNPDNKKWSQRAEKYRNKKNKKDTGFSSSNLIYMRTVTSFKQSTANPDGTHKKRRFGIFINDALFTQHGLDKNEANSRIYQNLQQITLDNREKGKEFTPTKVAMNITVTDTSDQGSPREGDTPGGSKFKTLHTGFKSDITILCDDPSLSEEDIIANRKVLEDAAILNAFINSEPYKAVVPATAVSKAISFEITPEQQKRVKKEIDANDGRRKLSQNQIMAIDSKHVDMASATKILSAAQLYSTLVAAEYADLGAHSLTGNDSRVSKNLVITPQAPNTIMLIGPENLLHLLKRIYDKIKVDVLATTIQALPVHTHIGDQIFYTIHTDHFSLQFLIDGLNAKKPHIIVKFLHDVAYEVFIDMIQEKHAVTKSGVNSKPPAPKPPAPSNAKRALFPDASPSDASPSPSVGSTSTGSTSTGSPSAGSSTAGSSTAGSSTAGFIRKSSKTTTPASAPTPVTTAPTPVATSSATTTSSATATASATGSVSSTATIPCLFYTKTPKIPIPIPSPVPDTGPSSSSLPSPR